MTGFQWGFVVESGSLRDRVLSSGEGPPGAWPRPRILLNSEWGPRPTPVLRRNPIETPGNPGMDLGENPQIHGPLGGPGVRFTVLDQRIRMGTHPGWVLPQWESLINPLWELLRAAQPGSWLSGPGTAVLRYSSINPLWELPSWVAPTAVFLDPSTVGPDPSTVVIDDPRTALR